MSENFTYSLRSKDNGFYVRMAEDEGDEDAWFGPYPTRDAANDAVSAMLQQAAEDIVKQALGLN